jgi:hypothetical protein
MGDAPGGPRLDAESRRVAAQTGPSRFLAVQLGTDPETVIRWLVALPVMLIDPSAVVSIHCWAVNSR